MKRGLLSLIIVMALIVVSSCKKEDNNTDTPPVYEKSNLQQYVKVERVAGETSCTFTFSKQGNWKIFVGTSPEDIDMKAPVAESDGATIILNGLDFHTRYYFTVVLNDKEKSVIATTGVAIKGQKNFRDLGGIITTEGKSIKWGMIFRSGELNRLSDDDVKYMASMNIEELIDFRTDEEKANAPDKLPEGINIKNIVVDEGVYSREQMVEWLIAEDSMAFDTMLVHANKVFVTDAQSEFSSFLKELENGKRLVFHCSAGKDRAGYATVLFLSALGVDKETIIKDYLASNEYNAEWIEGTIQYINSIGMNGELLRPSLIVKREYIEEAYSIIDNKYGGMDEYLKLLGVDKEKLKSLYLE